MGYRFRGRRLGSYEIVSALGTGGMGEVYLAAFFGRLLETVILCEMLPRMLRAHFQAKSGKTRVGGPIRSGNLIFVGGIGGWYPEKRPEGPGDVRRQFSDALDSMKGSLEKAGTTMANVLQVSVPLVDPETNWPALQEVFNQYFPEPRPALICFGAAGYRRAEQLLQVECICYVD